MPIEDGITKEQIEQYQKKIINARDNAHSYFADIWEMFDKVCGIGYFMPKGLITFKRIEKLDKNCPTISKEVLKKLKKAIRKWQFDQLKRKLYFWREK